MLSLMCTQAEYDSASPDDRRDFDVRLVEQWRKAENRGRDRDYALDRELAEGQW